MKVFLRRVRKQEDGLAIIEVEEAKIGLTWKKGERWRFYHVKTSTYADFEQEDEGLSFIVDQEVGTKG